MRDVRGARSARRVNQKLLPLPGAEARPISPPMLSASRLQMASPSPVPRARRRASWSTCVKAVNSFFCCARDRPMPVSVTVIFTVTPVPRCSMSRARTSTEPRSVNLMALPIRLVSNWRIRSGSPSRRSGTSGWRCAVCRRPFSSASGASMACTSSISAGKSTTSCSMARAPASRLEKSRMRLIRASDDLALLCIVSTYSCCVFDKFECFSKRVKPMMQFSGVRNSWLIWVSRLICPRLALAASRRARRREWHAAPSSATSDNRTMATARAGLSAWVA